MMSRILHASGSSNVPADSDTNESINLGTDVVVLVKTVLVVVASGVVEGVVEANVDGLGSGTVLLDDEHAVVAKTQGNSMRRRRLMRRR